MTKKSWIFEPPPPRSYIKELFPLVNLLKAFKSPFWVLKKIFIKSLIFDPPLETQVSFSYSPQQTKKSNVFLGRFNDDCFNVVFPLIFKTCPCVPCQRKTLSLYILWQLYNWALFPSSASFFSMKKKQLKEKK